ncbi:hypothetical protein YC2023_063421 [Brassica napus]
MGLVSYYIYKSIIPPPPIPLPENVSEISPRIKLNDGRYLAYKELGFTKDKAKNKIIIIHGNGNSKDIYFLLFDRAGYGESDPNPLRTLRKHFQRLIKLF